MLLDQVRTRLELLAKDLAYSQAQNRREVASKEAALAIARKTSAAARQKKIDSFFAKPLAHDVRPRAMPAELGEGYTKRSIQSGTFATHVKAIEVRIAPPHTTTPSTSHPLPPSSAPHPSPSSPPPYSVCVSMQ